MLSFEIGRDTFYEGIQVDTRGEPCLRLGAGNSEYQVPLSESLATQVMESGEDSCRVSAVDCVIAKQEDKEQARLIAERTPYDKRALVKLDCTLQPGSFGQLLLLSNCYDEKLIKNDHDLVERVVRDYKPWPPIGIHLLAEGGFDKQYKHKGQEFTETRPVFLFEMLPGASFRIRRDRHIPIREVVISWNGKELFWITPRKFKDRSTS